MIFYYNAGGELLSAVFEEVYQGSNKATPIYFACTTSSLNTVDVAFELPDGSSTARHVMTAVENSVLSGVYDGDGREFNVWKYDLPTLITEKQGQVTVQFYINEVGATVSTAAVRFNVNKGVAGIVPEIGDSYSELVALVSEHSGRIASAEDDISDKLDKKTANGNYSKVYGFNQDGQTEFTVGTDAMASQIPLYDQNANLSTGNPLHNTDAANKNYVDANFGKTVEMSMDNSTYVLTLSLKNTNGSVLSSTTVDLPLESVVVEGAYENSTKSLKLTLQSGDIISIPVSDLITGLQKTLMPGVGISFNNDTVSVTNKGGSFTVLSTAWTNGSATVSIPDFGANDKIDVWASSYVDQQKIVQAQLFVESDSGRIIFTAQETPTDSINFQYFITRGCE